MPAEPCDREELATMFARIEACPPKTEEEIHALFAQAETFSEEELLTAIRPILTERLSSNEGWIFAHGLIDKYKDVLPGETWDKLSSDAVVDELLRLLTHEDACVQEGALDGLSHHLNWNETRRWVKNFAAHPETNSTIKAIALEVLASD